MCSLAYTPSVLKNLDVLSSLTVFTKLDVLPMQRKYWTRLPLLLAPVQLRITRAAPRFFLSALIARTARSRPLPRRTTSAQLPRRSTLAAPPGFEHLRRCTTLAVPRGSSTFVAAPRSVPPWSPWWQRTLSTRTIQRATWRAFRALMQSLSTAFFLMEKNKHIFFYG